MRSIPGTQWQRRWEAISARAEGLVKATELFAVTVTGTDLYNVEGRVILPELQAIRAEVADFLSDYSDQLPSQAKAVLERFATSDARNVDPSLAGGISFVIPLVTLRTSFAYLVRDEQAEVRSLTELAFEHLRRQIAVDDDVRAKWMSAFDEREEWCEKLGAVHLLSHGIWAFKIKAIGATTDLVFDDPLEQHATEVRRSARGIVATEWKIVRSAGEMDQKATVARAQLKEYRQGALADLTLTSTRFVVLVSAKAMEIPSDFVDSGVTYRHVAIVVDPDSPSKAARAITRKPQK